MFGVRKKTEESPSDVIVKQAGNGYIVIRQERLGKPKTIRTMFGAAEIEDQTCEYVFTNLSEVAEFLSKHYEDPLVRI